MIVSGLSSEPFFVETERFFSAAAEKETASPAAEYNNEERSF